MKVNVNLPQLMDFRDYHDIRYLQDELKKVIPSIKAKELGCIDGTYIGLFYIERNKAYAKCVAEYKKIEKSWNKQLQEMERQIWRR